MKRTLDWNKYIECARQAVAEGCVLLENNGVLPFAKDSCISIFGRIQTHYYKSGTGSGGMVNVSHVTGIPEGLKESGIVTVNEELESVYAEWEKENPFDTGLGWGMEPWSQVEMPLAESVVETAAGKSDVALVIIGRTAGEDKDASETEGSYCLTEIEKENIRLIRKHFGKVVILQNIGGLMDMTFVDEYKPDAVLICWQGGMVGGHGTADILTGKVSPSGHLSDTIAYSIHDYLSDKTFGDPVRNIYEDDIYVGYRYFETSAPEKVRYPFGFGLSYTTFQQTPSDFVCNKEERKITFKVTVTNTGKVSGKESVQVYVSAPEGKLPKAVKVLADFAKTSVLEPGKSETVSMEIPFESFASYDDKGVTGNKSSWILEAGDYEITVGNNVRNTVSAGKTAIEETVISTMNPVFENASDLDARIKANMPEEYAVTGRTGVSLKEAYDKMLVGAAETEKDVMASAVAWNDDAEEVLKKFVAQMSDEELAAVVRGEGMGSSLVTPGTAAAFGGVSASLRELGLVPCCCDDGPSGMRLDCGTKAFSLPNGTMLACTFNKELNTELFAFLSMEMVSNKVDNLLGPGINIHRHPLNGRNFEYFSEDPILTGMIATAQLKGLKTYGASGTIKHFAGNNQELMRRSVDSVISERALREIYLKGFELCVKSGYADSIMTTYGQLNGTFTSMNYDLCTTILRGDWGYKGIVMTDWWASITMPTKTERGNTNFDYLVRSQNDLYMVCPNGETNASGDNTIEALAAGTITRGELQRAAMNVSRYVLHSEAFRRSIGIPSEVEIINRPKDADDVDMSNVDYTVLGNEMTVDLSVPESDIGSTYVFAFDVSEVGMYRITLRASSEMGEVAQLPCTLIFNGFPVSTMTFHGTDGKVSEISKVIRFHERFTILRLTCNARGLKLHDITFKKHEDPIDPSEKIKTFDI
ncbi:MAG: glycoside hydrolase family 3 C-terminal domain-containing protein [Treponema sp.]|nr:glycoside hydrolase family 3 C-terminal domain-containing protein [Treponema sp.]